MRLLGLSSAAIPILLALAPGAGFGQPQQWKREGDSWVRVYSGTIPATARLRVMGHGPVSVSAGPGHEISYTVKVSVMTPSAARAQAAVNHQPIHLETDGDWAVLTTPGGAAMATVTIRAPHLQALAVFTASGAVDAKGVDGPVEVETGAGEVSSRPHPRRLPAGHGRRRYSRG